MKCAEKDKYLPPARTESRRLVRGGRKGAGKITLEQRAEPEVGSSGRPRYRAELEWPDVFRQEEWYRRGYAFVSLWRQGLFCSFS